MTAFQAEGCGIALWGRRAARVQKVQRVRPAFGRLVQRVAVSPSRAMSMKSALRDLLFCVIGHKKHSLISHLRWLSPLWCLTAPKGECISSSGARLACFPTPTGRLYGFRRQRRYKKWRQRRRTSPAQRYYITPEGGALNPPVRRSRSQAEPLAPRAKGPATPSTLTPVRACQPSGIPASTTQVPVPIPTAPQADSGQGYLK